MSEFVIDEMVDGHGRLRPHWRELLDAFSMLGDGGLAERGRRLERAFAEDGLTSVMPGEARLSWRMDPIPFPIPADEFAAVEAGLSQRAGLLSAILDDVYGPQTLLAEGLLPPALVFANPRYLRLGPAPLFGPKLHIYSADLIRGADGAWQVLADRTGQAGGIGWAQENRRQLTRVLPEAFRAVGVRPLQPFFDRWQEALRPLAPPGRANPSIAVLTPGTGHRLWFEHMHLARLLSCALVEGGDLTVRDGSLFLKTMRGLQPIDLILRQMDGSQIDPLELDAESWIGVPGLLDAARTDRVRILNRPGTEMVEAPGIAALLPMLCHRLRAEVLQLANARSPMLASMAPCLGTGQFDPRPVVWRTFLMFDGLAWHMLPGGVARVVEPGQDADQPGIAKDVWVLHDEQNDNIGPIAAPTPRLGLRRNSGELPSRVADNLFWLGRTVERLDRVARLGRAALARLTRMATPRELVELQALTACLIDAQVIDAEHAAPASLGPALLAALRPGGAIDGLFAGVARLTEKVRDRLTGDMYATFTQTMRAAQAEAIQPDLDATRLGMAAILRFCTAVAGVAADNMVRGGGFLFLDLGRRIERAQAVTHEVSIVLNLPPARIESGLLLALELCDSAITYRSRYLNVLQAAPVLDLVLADQANPRGLAFQLVAMHGLLDELGSESGVREMLAGSAAGLLAEVEMMVGEVLAAPDQASAASALPGRLAGFIAELEGLSSRITRRYFAVLPAIQLVGTGETLALRGVA